MPKEKKRKRNSDGPANGEASFDLDTSKPSAVFTPQGGRPWTLTVALPGSIVANAKSHDQKTHLAGHVARALAVFCVDEVVIFDDGDTPEGPVTDPHAYTAYSHPAHFLAHLLSYLETPAYLRRALFPMHPDLKTAGTLPSLDMPHHLRAGEWCDFREGVVTRHTAPGRSHVDVGLADERVVAGEQIPVHSRVTLRLDRDSLDAEAVGPATPREAQGYYWGYAVRRCAGLSAVFTECPFDGGYDVCVGTSERGGTLAERDVERLSEFKHLLLVFGGVTGLETAAANDSELAAKGIFKGNVGDLFDVWLNVLPGQGSRTIRTEEAVWLGLMSTRKLVDYKTR